MKKVVVVTKSIEFYKLLNNNMCEGARIVDVSTSYTDSIEFILEDKPDIIVYEIELKYYKIINLINKIKSKIDYNPTIILVNNLNLYDIKSKYKNCIVIKENSDSFLVIYKIINHIKNSCSTIGNLDDKILREMHKMGFEMKNKGDQMLFKVIKYIKTHEGVGSNLEKDIYHSIAIKTDIPESQIKWNINYSINSIYQTKTNTICRYLKIENDEKPTSKFVIFALLNNI